MPIWVTALPISHGAIGLDVLNRTCTSQNTDSLKTSPTGTSSTPLQTLISAYSFIINYKWNRTYSDLQILGQTDFYILSNFKHLCIYPQTMVFHVPHIASMDRELALDKPVCSILLYYISSLRLPFPYCYIGYLSKFNLSFCKIPTCNIFYNNIL